MADDKLWQGAYRRLRFRILILFVRDAPHCPITVFRDEQRTVVREISGQTGVPVLVDGKTVLDDDDVIIPYLEKTYGQKAVK